MLARRVGSHLRRPLVAWMSDAMSVFNEVPMGPPDAILGLTEAFKKDTFEKKVNVGVGAYRDDENRPYVLESVRAAEKAVFERGMDHEYAPITGVPEFVRLSTEFAYGKESSALAAGRVAASQSISGTGALRVMFSFVSRFWGAGTRVFLPTPTWGNHIPLARDAGLEPAHYRYVGSSGVGVDVSAMLEDLHSMPSGSLVLLHACAHNPSGCDPTAEEWAQILACFQEKGHIPLFDCAYQGFASGDAEIDASAFRSFVEADHPVFLAQSFAKNFGLYGQRVGTVSVACADEEEKERVLSQLKIIIRPMYSSPPIHGARLVAEVLSNPSLKTQWEAECKGMADRINEMRALLVHHLEQAGSQRDWSHLTSQIGMFSYTGLSEEQVAQMVNQHHIYMTKDGRISMAGVNSTNVDYIAQAIHKVTQ